MMPKPCSHIFFLRETRPRIIHRAKWVMIDPHTIIENGCVEVENFKIRRVFKAGRGANGPGNIKGMDVKDHGTGVLMPFLINAHLHLELSALKGCLPLGAGFQPWVQALLKQRDSLGGKGLMPAAQEAAKDLFSLGIGAVGEISTLGITRSTVVDTGLFGVWFQEFLGKHPLDIDMGKTNILSFSMAGHAPHTTDPDLLKQVKAHTRDHGLPFSIHLAESDAETRFLQGREGQWKRFLIQRGIDTRTWPLGACSPVAYLDRLGLLDPMTLCVHLLNVDHRDLGILADSGAKICLCPRSNMNLHNRLPDIPAMLGMGLAPALGTDSLASCDSLNIFDEMAFVTSHFPGISPEEILTMATINGSHALGIGPWSGTLEKGKSSRLIHVPVRAASPIKLLERLVSNEFY